MTLLCFLYVLFAIQAPEPTPPTSGEKTKPVVSYRILSDITATLPIGEVLRELRVSVHQWLPEKEIKELVCEITSDHQVDQAHRVRIVVYYNLDEWVPEPDSLNPAAAANLRSYLARYEYSESMPADHLNLHIYKDVKGGRLRNAINSRFDYRQDCPKQSSTSP